MNYAEISDEIIIANHSVKLRVLCGEKSLRVLCGEKSLRVLCGEKSLRVLCGEKSLRVLYGESYSYYIFLIIASRLYPVSAAK
jgi:hypothetical protein